MHNSSHRSLANTVQDREDVLPSKILDEIPQQDFDSGHSPTLLIKNQTIKKSTKSTSFRKPSFSSMTSFSQRSNLQSTFDKQDVKIQEESKHQMNIPNSNEFKEESFEQSGSGELIKRKKYRQYQLKDLIFKQKVVNIERQFAKKLKRNNTHSKPIQFQLQHDGEGQQFFDLQGIEVNYYVENFIALLNVIQIIALSYVYTLALVYEEVYNNAYITGLQTFSFFFYVFETFLNFITIKSHSGRRLTTLRQIGENYISGSFLADAICVFILLTDIYFNFYVLKYLRLFIILKLGQCLDKIQKLEVFLIKNYYNEQYWSLIKVLIFNFCFAHILAIFLTSMTSFSPDNNWIITKGLQHTPWYQKYIWAYYWGTTVMLTVGFGDIVATNYQQALCLVFIEMLSCIILAYNINCVGALVSNIRSQDLQKSKKFKMFKKLSDKNELPEELSWRITNYIEQSVNIKKKFNIQEENSFVQKLPVVFRRQFLKESNKVIFQSLTFFRGLVEKTLCSFAQKIEMHISHPQETLRALDDDYNLLILKTGEIGFCAKNGNSIINDKVVDKMKVEDDQPAFLVGLEFITKKRPPYEIKSLQYSVIYFLDYQSLISIIKETNLDYQLYSLMRDKNKNIIDEFQVFKCQFCENCRHTKFLCPKLHYTPYQQQVINKHIHALKTVKDKRNKAGTRLEIQRICSLKNYKPKFNDFQQPALLQKRDSTPHVNCGKSILQQYLSKKFSPNQTQLAMKSSQRLLLSATQMIKDELCRILRVEANQDEIWMVNCDIMKNYKGYFALDNPNNLEDKFNLEVRIQKMRAIQMERGSSKIITNKFSTFTMSSLSQRQMTSSTSQKTHKNSQKLKNIDSIFQDQDH